MIHTNDDGDERKETNYSLPNSTETLIQRKYRITNASPENR